MHRSALDCLTEQEIEEYVLKQVSGSTLDTIEEHLLACTICVEKVEAEERFVNEFRPVAQLFQKKHQQEQPSPVHAPVPVRPERKVAPEWTNWLAGFWLRPQGWITAGASVAIVMLILTVGQQKRIQAEQPVYLDIALKTQRGGESTAESRPGPAKGRRDATLRLTVDLTELPRHNEYPVDMVDNAGNPVVKATLKPEGGKLVWRTGIMPVNGTYWVRLLNPSDQGLLLREFGLQVSR